MFIEWSESLEIGDPVVDSEHRYMVHLINNLHEQYIGGTLGGSLAKVFTHLAQYVRVHFENEESLMAAIGYPDLQKHRKEHRQLLEQSMALSEKYLDGSGTVTEETLIFLKEWAVNHISDSDMKIRQYFKGQRPSELTSIPAFANSSDTEFKKCTFCGKTWRTFEDLKNDNSKTLKGCQLDQTNHLYNLIMFNCSCNTTLAMFLKEFVPQADIPFVINEHNDSSRRPSWCLIADSESPCLEKCACAYTIQILEALGQSDSYAASR